MDEELLALQVAARIAELKLYLAQQAIGAALRAAAAADRGTADRSMRRAPL